MDSSQGLTFVFWVKREGRLAGQQSETIISKYRWFTGQRNFLVRPTVSVYFYKSTQNNPQGEGVSAQMGLNDWHHVVINVTGQFLSYILMVKKLMKHKDNFLHTITVALIRL